MSQSNLITPESFTSFGDLLKYLRRRAQLSQRDLSIAVGYSEPQISYLETNSRLPDVATVAARFVPALDLADEPGLAHRLLELAQRARRRTGAAQGDLTPAGSGPVQRGNLPAQATALIGRERELAVIADLLASPDCRLLTLVGVGGIGKTRLALAAAQRTGDFPDGVWFVSLASVSSAELLATAIMDALQVARFGDAPPDAQLLHYIRDKEMLLVLDNFEHLMAGATLLTRALETGAGLRLLVTSRERLRLQAEWLYPVGGLALPKEDAIEVRPDLAGSADDDHADRPTQPDVLTPDDAIRLFVQSARRADSAFRLTPANAGAVWRICKHVDGMPLGIELAAGWTRLLTCDEIADQLTGSLNVLRSQTRDVPARQSSLQAVFEHSWRMLTSAERAVLAQLSVFRGGFDLAAAQAVAGADLETLSGLLDKSWLRVIEGRYDVHELVRQFAFSKLTAGDEGLPADPDGQAAARRHSAYFSDLLRRLYPVLLTGQQFEAAAVILREIGNVQAGWRWVVQNDEAEHLEGYLDALCWMVWYRGWYAEMQRALTEAAARLRAALTDSAVAEADRRRFRRVLLLVLWQRATMEYGFNLPPERTAANWQEYLDFWHSDGAGLLTAEEEASNQLALAGWYDSRAEIPDGDKAIRLTQEALAYYLEHGNAILAAAAWNNIGLYQHHLGRYQESREALTQAIATYERAGEQLETSSSYAMLADCLLASGDLVEARRLFDYTVSFGRETGGPANLYNAILLSGECSLVCGEFGRARREFAEGLELAQQLGQTHLEIWPRRGLAQVLYAEGDYQTARDALAIILDIARELGTFPKNDDVRVTVGRVECALGNHKEAAEVLLEALAVSERLQTVKQRTKALAAIVALLCEAGRSASAAQIAAFLDVAPEADCTAKRSARELLSILAPGAGAAGSNMTLDACVALARCELTAIAA